VFLLITFVGSLGEETGWRGYALPQLQRRFSPLTATVILAPLWFWWHLPQFAVIGTYRDFGPAGYVGMFLGLTCGAIVLTWLYNRSGGSILLVIVWHGVYNSAAARRRPLDAHGQEGQRHDRLQGGRVREQRMAAVAKPDSTWAWKLSRLDGGRTRLVTWLKQRYTWEKPGGRRLSPSSCWSSGTSR
jgi:hypothetical protein